MAPGFEIDPDAMEAAQLAWRGYMQSGLVMDAKSPANPLYLFAARSRLPCAEMDVKCPHFDGF